MNYRRLILRSGVWQYRVGLRYVHFLTPAGHQRIVPCQRVLGTDLVTWEKVLNRDGGIIPVSRVKTYINRYLVQLEP